MSNGPTSIEMRTIEKVLDMGGGYVLDFTNATFAEFFQDYGIDIEHERYRAQGDSKAKRLRCFLRTAPPLLAGRVLAGLLEHRFAMDGEELPDSDVAKYGRIVHRLGATPPDKGATEKRPEASEAELFRREFRPEKFQRLPMEPQVAEVLVARMEEAGRCIEAESYLAAIILCGSVLEGMCLGFGSRHPERVNRAYAAQYGRSPKQFAEWKLKEWIEVLARLGDFSPNVEKFGTALRDFRNYVHPAEQLAHKFTPNNHTARIGFQVVLAAADDLIEGGSA